MYGKCRLLSNGQSNPQMTSLLKEASAGISDVIYGFHNVHCLACLGDNNTMDHVKSMQPP